MENFYRFYLGSNTDRGKLVGTCGDILFIESGGEIMEYPQGKDHTPVRLHLKRLSTLTESESLTLINKGFSIGRPRGYSFSPEAFLFLLNLRVDLFGLIDSGLAAEISA